MVKRERKRRHRFHLHLPSLPARRPRRHWGILDGIEDFFDGVLDWW